MFSVTGFCLQVAGKAWTYFPCVNAEGITKLCNHKRKMLQSPAVEISSVDTLRMPKAGNYN